MTLQPWQFWVLVSIPVLLLALLLEILKRLRETDTPSRARLQAKRSEKRILAGSDQPRNVNLDYQPSINVPKNFLED